MLNVFCSSTLEAFRFYYRQQLLLKRISSFKYMYISYYIIISHVWHFEQYICTILVNCLALFILCTSKPLLLSHTKVLSVPIIINNCLAWDEFWKQCEQQQFLLTFSMGSGVPWLTTKYNFNVHALHALYRGLTWIWNKEFMNIYMLL